jgi:hypothetical protein
MAAELPVDFFQNPCTARVFTKRFPGIDPAELLHKAGDALSVFWALDYGFEDVDGLSVPMFLGPSIGWSSQSMQVLGMCSPGPGGSFLALHFGDLNQWTEAQTGELLTFSLGAVNAALQSRFPGAALEAFALR